MLHFQRCLLAGGIRENIGSKRVDAGFALGFDLGLVDAGLDGILKLPFPQAGAAVVIVIFLYDDDL